MEPKHRILVSYHVMEIECECGEIVNLNTSENVVTCPKCRTTYYMKVDLVAGNLTWKSDALKDK